MIFLNTKRKLSNKRHKNNTTRANLWINPGLVVWDPRGLVVRIENLMPLHSAEAQLKEHHIKVKFWIYHCHQTRCLALKSHHRAYRKRRLKEANWLMCLKSSLNCINSNLEQAAILLTLEVVREVPLQELIQKRISTITCLLVRIPTRVITSRLSRCNLNGNRPFFSKWNEETNVIILSEYSWWTNTLQCKQY